MFPDTRRWFRPAVAPLQRLICLCLISAGLQGCGDIPESDTLPALDSGADTAIWLVDVQSIATETRDPELQARAYNSIGNYYWKLHLVDSALHHFKLARESARKNKLVHEQVFALGSMALCYRELQNDDSALVLMQEALRVSTEGKSNKDIAYALQELGIYYLDNRDSANALKYFREEIKYDTLLRDSSALAGCFSNMAIVYLYTGDYPRSIQSYERAIAIAQRLQNDTFLAIYHLNLGMAFREQGSFDFSLDQFLHAAPVFEGIHYTKEQASCYNSIGNIYLDINEPEKALEYHVLALSLRDSIGNRRGSAGSLTNLGQTYILLKQYDTAISYLNRSLLIKEQLRDTAFIATSVDLLGEAYYHKGEYAQAETHYLNALALKSTMEDPRSTSITLNKLGKLYHAWNKDGESLRHLHAARVKLERINAKKDLLDNYKAMANVFLENGNSDSALFYTDLLIAMKDSVMSEQKQKALTEMQVKYDSEKKEQEIVLLNERNRTKEATVDRQNTLIYSLIAGALLLIVVVVLLFVAVRSRRLALAQSKVIIGQKQTIIEQKQAMMSELHHRIKNNLQVLSGLLELQQSRIKDPAMTELMQAIDQRLTAMLLIHQGLYGDHVGSQVNISVYIDALILNLCQSYGYTASELKITKNILPIELDADKALSLGFVCNEIISNWFKHVLKEKEQATLRIEFTGNTLSFSDNGRGIPPEKNNHSASFGMRLIQLFSQELKAKLNIQSDTRGTTITLEISNP